MKRITLTWMASGKWIPPDEAEHRAMLQKALATVQTDLVLVEIRQTQVGTAGVYQVEADIDLMAAPDTLTLDRIGQWMMEQFQQGARLLILRERT
jgi:hypothetical protein